MTAAAAPSRPYYAALLAIVLLATVMRVHNLRDLPPGLFCDEAGNGYNAYSLAQTGRDENGELLPLYIWSFGVAYKNPVYIYAAAGPVAFFGLNEASVRLTSALFGILAVIAMAIVGRQLGGAATGLLSALLLAVCPWHLHFSRIGFELIAFPTLFLFAFAAMVAGIRGRHWLLPVAAGLFSLCLYTYGPAKLFVPLFLLGAGIVYARRLWRSLRWAALAALVAAAVATPAVTFDLTHRDRAQQYFRNTTSLRLEQGLSANVTRVAQQYRRFFSPDFLFEKGDPLVRHAVPGFGELPLSFLPLLAMGAIWALWPRNPEGKLILWWLFLFPLAPSMMNEIPSASRSVIGVAGFCLLAGCGGGAFLRVIRWLFRWPAAAIPLQTVAVAALLAVLGVETWRYWQAYTTSYPEQAANDFQYGYREAIEFMEKRRGDYDLLMLTANDVNQPQIFAAFYRPVEPTVWQRSEDSGYLIIDPSEYDRYRMNQRILAALREEDLRLFDDYTELRRVLRPNGEVEYVIAEPHVRRRFIREWLLLGPFPTGSINLTPAEATMRGYPSPYGEAYWRRTTPQFVDVNLNDFYGRTSDRAGRALSGVCAYGVTQVEVPEARRAQFEVDGVVQLRGWVNGEPFGGAGTRLTGEPRRFPIALRAGWNQVMIQVCKLGGDWRFRARITGDDGHDLPDFRVRARAPLPPVSGGEPSEPEQIVDGMGEPVAFEHDSPTYSDYRGDSPGWWQHLGDSNGALVWKTAPIPEKKPTAVVFTGNVGEAKGRADLYVNGQYALTFRTGRFEQPQRWERGPYVLEYNPQERGHWTSGPWKLWLPASAVTPGEPVTLRVAHRSGSRQAFFMVKGRHDTAQFEKLDKPS